MLNSLAALALYRSRLNMSCDLLVCRVHLASSVAGRLKRGDSVTEEITINCKTV